MKSELDGTVDVGSPVVERQRHRTATSDDRNKLAVGTLALEELQRYHLSVHIQAIVSPTDEQIYNKSTNLLDTGAP